MNKEEYLGETEQNLFHVYQRFPVIFHHGEGVYLYDTDQNKYLDFGSGIGVMALGYHDAEYTQALKDQVDLLLHTSNLYYHQPLHDAGEAVVKVCGMDRVFFTNSGAEAIEGALKTAKKYAYQKHGKKNYEVIAMEHSFHGRTVGALSVTGNEHYREAFYPLMDGARFATFNDYESVEELVNENTCAILMETIQGEGGIYPADREFLCKIRRLCDEKGILLILDEIQCGIGRSGSMFAFQSYGIRPDILTMAKALGGGVPVGAFAVTEEVAAHSLVPGDHGTTYGGNPLVTRAVSTSLSILEKRDITGHVKELTPYFEGILDDFVRRYDFVQEHRGMGFMQGLVLTIPVGDVVKKGLEEGLVLLSAGNNVLRMLPPLIMDKDGFDEMHEKLTRIFDGFA